MYKGSTTGNAYLDMSDLAGEAVITATQTGVWQYISTSWTSPANMTVVIRLVTDGSPNGPVWFDDVNLSAVASPTPTPTATNTPGPSPTPTATPLPGSIPAGQTWKESAQF